MRRWKGTLGGLAALGIAVATGSIAQSQPGVNGPAAVTNAPDPGSRRLRGNLSPGDTRGTDAEGAKASDVGDHAPLPSDTLSIRGKVTKASGKSVQVKSQDGREESLAIDSHTQVVRVGETSAEKTIATKDLKPGAEVQAAFSRANGKATATQIELLSPASAVRGGTSGAGTSDSGDFLDSTGGALGDEPGAGRLGGSGSTGRGVDGSGSPAQLEQPSSSGKP